jgi:hypothetical protein
MGRMGQAQITVKRWRTWILTILVVAILFVTVPAAIRRILQTGDLYLFTREFFDDLLARLSGAGRFRFVLQPIVAVLLGSRDGLKDARKGRPPYLWALAFHVEHRRELLRGTFVSIREVVAVAILLDILSQFLIFHEIHPGAAFILGPVLIGVPYAVARAITGRIARKKVSERQPSI